MPLPFLGPGAGPTIWPGSQLAGSIPVLNQGGGGMVADGIAASIDMDFAHGQYFGKQLADLTCTRASTAMYADASGTWRSAASNVLRIHTDPVTAAVGAWIEEARTNSIRNNSMQGAVAGTPGTMPTNWTDNSTNPTSGLTRTIVAVGVENGLDYIDIRWAGTATASVTINLLLEGNAPTPVAASGQTWTASMFARLVSGTYIPNSLRIYVAEFTDTTIGSADSVLFATLDATIQQKSVTRLFTGGTTNRANSLAQMSFNNGQIVDQTMRIYMPQLEQGAMVTSPIRTTGTAATRAADVISVNSPPAFGAAFSIFAEANWHSPAALSTTQPALSADDGTLTNRNQIYRATGVAASFTSTVTGSQTTGTRTASSDAFHKTAAAFGNGDQAMSVDGQTAEANAGAAGTPVASQIGLGKRADAGTFLNGLLRRIAIWPTKRVSNAELQRITT